MGKIFKKNIDTQDDIITVDNELIEPLFHTERWSEKVKKSISSDTLGDELLQSLCVQPTLCEQSIDVERLTKITSEDIIDKFLRADTHRIVAEEGEVTQEIVVEAALDDEDDMVSEELAEI